MRLNFLDKMDYAIFRRYILTILVMVFAIISSNAQGFFDDKKLDKPVPHICAYDNDRWCLEGIERSKSHTLIRMRYLAAFMDAGWSEKLDGTTTLTDQATGKKYPLIDSQGIPKEPGKYVWEVVTNNINIPVTLVFGPIPENVQKITLDGFGLSDIEIGRVPVAPKGGDTKFYGGKTNQSGELTLEAVNDDGEVTIMFFSYKPKNESKTIWYDAGANLKDRSTGKTYPVAACIGLPESPEKIYLSYDKYHEANNKPVGFFYAFPSMKSNGVMTVDFIDGNWSIQDIAL